MVTSEELHSFILSFAFCKALGGGCLLLYSKHGLRYKAILRLEVLRHGARLPNPETLLLTFYKPNGKQCGNQLM